jgi:hypothetical protein
MEDVNLTIAVSFERSGALAQAMPACCKIVRVQDKLILTLGASLVTVYREAISALRLAITKDRSEKTG